MTSFLRSIAGFGIASRPGADRTKAWNTGRQAESRDRRVRAVSPIVAQSVDDAHSLPIERSARSSIDSTSLVQSLQTINPHRFPLLSIQKDETNMSRKQFSAVHLIPVSLVVDSSLFL